MSLSTNLVSYWKFDESSGNATDSVGSNTLTNVNTATYSPGKINNGVNLVRTFTQYLKITDASQSGLDITGDMTLAGWLNLTTLPGTTYPNDSRIIGAKWNTLNQSYLCEFINDGSGNYFLRFLTSSTGSNVGVGDVAWTPSILTWYHVAFVYTASLGKIECFVNGSSIGSTTGSLHTSMFSGAADFDLGTLQADTTQLMDGSLDEFGIWNRTLSSGEITSLYNGGTGLSYPFQAAYTLLISVGTFTLTGITANLTRGITLVANVGRYVFTGNSINLKLKQWLKEVKHSSVLTNLSKAVSNWINDSK